MNPASFLLLNLALAFYNIGTSCCRWVLLWRARSASSGIGRPVRRGGCGARSDFRWPRTLSPLGAMAGETEPGPAGARQPVPGEDPCNTLDTHRADSCVRAHASDLGHGSPRADDTGYARRPARCRHMPDGF